MPTVKFINEKQTVEVPEGANLRREALKAGIELYPRGHRLLNCHGLGSCGSCQIVLRKGQEHASRQSWYEKLRLMSGPLTFLTRLSHRDPVRLACRTRVYGDMEVETQPGINWHGENFWS